MDTVILSEPAGTMPFTRLFMMPFSLQITKCLRSFSAINGVSRHVRDMRAVHELEEKW